MTDMTDVTDVTTIDTGYLGREEFAAAYLIQEKDEAVFVETNTAKSVPRLLQALEARGLSPQQVRYVIITHVHLDHAGGASALMKACPQATLLAHPRAAPHVIDPSKLVDSAKKVYGEDTFTELYGTIEPIDEARVRTMDDGETLEWGRRTLSFLHTRGHANHHFCALDSGSDSIFTGDAFGLVYPALQGNGRFAIPSTSPTDFDAREAVRSVERIVGSGAKRAYLTHYGAVDDLKVVGGQLRAQLEEYGAIADHAFDAGLKDAALDAHCKSQVDALFERLLTDHGMGEQAREILSMDRDLNAQGVAFSVRKRLHKAKQAGG